MRTSSAVVLLVLEATLCVEHRATPDLLCAGRVFLIGCMELVEIDKNSLLCCSFSLAFMLYLPAPNPFSQHQRL